MGDGSVWQGSSERLERACELLRGDPSRDDELAARAMLEQLDVEGYEPARLPLAMVLRATADSPEQMQRALELLLDEAEAAACDAGLLCEAGKLACELRDARAGALLRRAADAGREDAELWFAIDVFESSSDEVRIRESVRVFERFEARDPLARAYLASCLLHGWGVPVDRERARRLARAAAVGAALGHEVLGGLEDSEPGRSPEKGREAAQPHYERAAQRGLAVAMVKVARYRLSAFVGNPEVVDPTLMEQAFTYLRRAMAFGLAEAKAVYGQALRFGHGVEADPERGMQLVREAAADGDGWAVGLMAFAHASGSFVERDEVAARAWAERAEAAGWQGMRERIEQSLAPKQPKGRLARWGRRVLQWLRSG